MYGRRNNKGPITRIESIEWYHDTPGGRSHCHAEEPKAFPALNFATPELRDKAYEILWDRMAINETTGEVTLSDEEPRVEHALVIGEFADAGEGQVEPDDEDDDLEEGQVEPDDEYGPKDDPEEPDDDEGQVEPDDDDDLGGVTFG